MGACTTIAPVVSKIFCSSSQAVLMVRRRPPTVNGGGFVVTDQNQRAVFSVDGCGILGASGQLIVRDGDGNAILFIHKKDPKPVLCMKGDVQVTVEPKGRNRHWDYEIGVKGMTAGRDFYQVVVQPGYDQAFLIGVIAILDNIHGESTRC
nr:unnamed protein product [Digitaria exilis]